MNERKIRKGQVIQKGKGKRLKMSMKVFEKEQPVRKTIKYNGLYK